MPKKVQWEWMFMSVRKILIKDPYSRFLKKLYRCDESRIYNLLGPFLDL